MKRQCAPLIALATLSVCLIAVACRTVPETGRKQVNFMNPADEAALGLTEFNKLKQEKPISKDQGYNALVQRVGDRLSKVMPVPNAEWEFVVFEDPSPNAFALPGGKVGVHTGLFQISQNEAGLAAVIGHEVAHVVARHSGERMSQGVLSGAAVLGAGYVLNKKTGSNGVIPTAALGGAALLATKAFSRKQELEADRMGAIFMARAGYDPQESVELWKRFAAWRAQSGQQSTPVFLASHPLDETRISELQRYMPEALEDYKKP
ncbi:MAG: M48 family metallopeptidase [Verrucomicrobiales bacterium]|nr:M48 family metallopeptidase [Verrucomicrobiales bacterium]